MSVLDIFRSKKNKKRNYDGASRGKRTSSWRSGSGDANSKIGPALGLLRDRARELRRNSAYAHKGLEVIVNNVVGRGIKTQFTQKNIQEQWKSWANSFNCDYDGKHTFAGLQRIYMGAIAESGEVLVRRRFVMGMTIPLQIQILEADFLDTNKTSSVSSKEGNYIIQGIEFNKEGKRVGYHIFESHPGSTDIHQLTTKSNFIPAKDILHRFRTERPGQERGVPWLAPVMIRLRDIDGFEDAQLMRQKVAACFAAFVHDINADVECEAASTDVTPDQMIEPGTIEFLPPGKTVTFADPPSVENYKEFVSSQLRSTAAGLGISAESLTGDLSEVNFSSARLGWLEMNRNIETWRDDLMFSGFINPVNMWFLDILGVLGEDVSDTSKTHTAPRREMIDPTKEIPAMVQSVRAGFTSRPAVVASLGEEVDDLDKVIEKDILNIDKKGFVFDSDARKTAKNGKNQEASEPQDGDADNEQENQDT